jgi:hypothetical protein
MIVNERSVTIIPKATEDLDEDDVITVLLWDGTTSGVLSPSAAISVSEISDINTSLHAAISNETIRSSIRTSTLVGAPVAITSSSCDIQIVKNLAKFKVGTWIRLRNFKINVPKKVIYSLATPDNSTSISLRTRGRPKRKDASLETTTAWLVGIVDSMTHLSVILPNFK